MAKYFSKFQKLQDLSTNNFITNIMQRVQVLNSVEDNTLVYYTYDLQEGDTPEIVAEKYYGDAERHWIVMMMNNIVDVYYDWPLSYTNFQKYVDNKYMPNGGNVGDGITYASSTIHHYELIINKTDSIDGSMTREVYAIDQNTYNTTPSSVVYGGTLSIQTSVLAVSIYDWETQVNDKKRTIKLLKQEYASQVEDELTKLLNP